MIIKKREVLRILKAIKFDSSNSILVICPNWVGDFVMATPTFQALRATFPAGRITLFAKPHLALLGKGAPWCDDLFLYDRKGIYKGSKGWNRLKSELRNCEFDLALVLPNSIRTGLIGKLSGATIRVGYDRPGGNLLLTHRLKRLKEGKKFLPVYGGEYYGKLFESFFPSKVKQKLDLPLIPEQDQFAKDYWEDVQPKTSSTRVAIAPGASFGSSKLWPTKHFSALIDMIAEEYQCKILMVPGPGEEELSEEIKEKSHSPVSILPPKLGKLDVLKSFLAQADLLICNDSGARHIAHAFGIKTVVLMGPTDPRHSENPDAPYEVLRNVVPCAPCHLKKCPYEHHACMLGIDPRKAFQLVKNYLGQSGTSTTK